MQVTADRLISLDRTLRAARFGVGPDQLLDARRLLDGLAGLGKEPADLDELAAYLAPIYCANEEQQQRFPGLLKTVLGAPSPDPVAPARTGKEKSNPLSDTMRAWTPQLLGLLAFAAFVLLLAFYLWPHRLTGTVVSGGRPLDGAKVVLSSSVREQLTDSNGRFEFEARRLDGRITLTVEKPGYLPKADIPVERFDDPDLRIELEVEPKPPEPTPPPPIPQAKLVHAAPPISASAPVYQTRKGEPRPLPDRIFLTALPILLFLAWWLYWVLRRRAWLQRMTGPLPDKIKHLQAGARREFSAALHGGQVAHELRRRHWQPSAQLHAEASVRASLRHLGEIRLVYGSRVEPEYLALIDESCASDHLGRLGDELMLSLENRDVLLTRYYFKDRLSWYDGPAPERKPRQPGLPLASLDALHASRGQQRLILVSDGQPLFDPLTGQPLPAVDLLLQWSMPTVLTPVPMADWGRREWALSQLGFVVLPLSAQGLTLLGELVGSDKPVPAVPADRATRFAKRWLRDPRAMLLPMPPLGQTPEQLCGELKSTLGDDAYLWLQACAVYPEIHWGLTLRLGAGLLPEDRRLAEALPKLVRLAWLRQAYLPNWLCNALTRDLSVQEWKRVNELLRGILDQASADGQGDIGLRIAADTSGPAWWQAIRGLFAGGKAQASPARSGRDTVYLRFLQGPPRLAVPAVEAILRFFFREGLWSAGIRALPLGCVALLTAMLVGWQWPPFVLSVKYVPAPLTQPPTLTALAMTGTAQDPVLAGYSDGRVRQIQLQGATELTRLKGGVEGFAYADDALAVINVAGGGAQGLPLRPGLDANLLKEFPRRVAVGRGAKPDAYRVNEANQGVPGDANLCAGILLQDNRRVAVTPTRLYVFDRNEKRLAALALPAPTDRCALRPGSDQVFGWNAAATGAPKLWRFNVRALRFETALTLAGAAPIEALSASRDGGTLWVLRNRQAEALDGGNGRLLLTLPVPVDALAAADDGQTVSVASNGAVQIWRLNTPRTQAAAGRKVLLAISGEYAGSSTPLRGIHAETQAFARLLRERYGYTVTALQDASKARVAEAFAKLAATLQPQDDLIVFIDGHGTKGAIYPSAGRKDASDQAISAGELSTWLARLPAGRVLTIVETANGRAMRDGGPAFSALTPRTRLLLSSALEHEYSYQEQREKPTSSAFINGLLDRLDQAEGPLTASDLLQALRARPLSKAGPQTPSLDPMPAAGHTGGDFLLAPVAKRPPKVGDDFRDCNDDACPWLVVIPPGRFLMGSLQGEKGRSTDEGPQHEVTIATPLAVMQTEVTRGQFAVFVKEMGYRPKSGCYTWKGDTLGDDPAATWEKPGFPQTDADPVVCVNWHDANAYVKWLGKRTGQPYRLLSEAEWEYAARAGSKTAYAFGENPDELCAHGNVADQSAKAEFKDKAAGWTFANCKDGHAYTAPVRSYSPNAFGLYDLIGNAWEWTEDCYHDSYQNAPQDGRPWIESSCETRVERGGAWNVKPADARSANRDRLSPGNRYFFAGFRVARTLSPSVRKETINFGPASCSCLVSENGTSSSVSCSLLGFKFVERQFTDKDSSMVASVNRGPVSLAIKLTPLFEHRSLSHFNFEADLCMNGAKQGDPSCTKIGGNFCGMK